ncbi:hypothetical protein [Streptomyces ehimensis]|uniref:Secreted protein n=1 Tax=Streptomyces ehimensis TaxID=68195 RepID=A0ABV9BW49_9ACTN
MNEGVAAVLAALIAVAGVGLGLFGARWQARAAQQQAIAAIEAVRAQGREQNNQWRRTLRRDVWVDFLGAVDSFIESVNAIASHQLEHDYACAQAELEGVTRQRIREVHDAFRKIELEGPEEIIDKAAQLRMAVRNTLAQLDLDVPARRGRQRLEEAALQEEGPAPATRALEALQRLEEEASRGEPSVEDAYATLQAVRDTSLLSDDEATATVMYSSRRRPEVDLERLITRGHWPDVVEARAAFVIAARAHLDGLP